MISIDNIRTRVQQFQEKKSFGVSNEDSFTPWWMKQKFKLSDEEATISCSDGNLIME